MTLDKPLCEWCSTSTVAVGTLHYYDPLPDWTVSLDMCLTHGNEAASEIARAKYNLYPYNTWEDAPDYADGILVRHVQDLEKLGIPYPVSGDATTIHQRTPWTMWHDPNGDQY